MTDTTKKSNVAIWKIDESFLINRTYEDFVTEISKKANQAIANGTTRLQEIVLDDKVMDTLNVQYLKLLRRARTSSGWYEFMSPILTEANREGKSFSTKQIDLLLFVGLGNDKLYCVATGSGYYMIESYIDDSFPFDVVRQLFQGEVKEASNRAITGQKFTETVSYRNDYGISSAEAFGKVWKQLRGPLDQESIRKYPELTEIIDVSRNPQAEAKSSFTLKKALRIDELISLMKTLDKIAVEPLSPEKKSAFRFLDMAKPVRDSKLKEQLRNHLFDMIYDDIKTGTNHCYEFDFCHPRHIEEFFGADKHYFQIGQSGEKYQFNLEDTGAPTVIDIIEQLRSIESLDVDRNIFRNVFSKITYYVSPHEDDTWRKMSTNLWKYLHGEVRYRNMTYFLIDQVWYTAKTEFLESLKDYFRETVEESETLQNSITFERYPEKEVSRHGRDGRENKFNQNQALKKDFWYGDVQYARYGRAGIELFDLLHAREGKTYVIQVKEGFAGTMRDACSQIKMASEAIVDDVRGSKKMLRSYYKQWSAAGYAKGLDEQEFLKLFNKKKLVFVIAIAVKHELTIENLLNDDKFRSHIAKFETEATIRHFNGRGLAFEIHRIVA